MPHIPSLGRNVQLKELEVMWGSLAESTLGLLGTTGTIFPFGDPHHGQPDAATFTSIGEEQLTFTWSDSNGPAAFDTALDPSSPDSFQGIIPFIDFNGSDEEADTPDIAYFSRDDSGSNPWSIGAWVNVTASAAYQTILSKWLNSSNLNEWRFAVDTSELLTLALHDESAAVTIDRSSDAALTTGVWTHIAATYDSAGGSSAADTITLYVDGAVRDSAATNNGSYVAMENLTSVVMLGGHDGSAKFTSKMAGASHGPWFTQIELTADAVKRIFQVQRPALAL